ncbi:hypothetical protein AB0O00_38250, partial [Kitasatospora sp. NPDC093558]
PTQRVHGDLHLGQVLRGRNAWALIDFEGEPSLPVAQRAAPHPVLRDVAGMLRSFDYAAHWTEHRTDPARPRGALPRPARRHRWAERAQDAFCLGYGAATGQDPRCQGVLLRAYTLHKAVYEVLYEARNRPGLLAVPLGAIARLAGTG